MKRAIHWKPRLGLACALLTPLLGAGVEEPAGCGEPAPTGLGARYLLMAQAPGAGGGGSVVRRIRIASERPCNRGFGWCRIPRPDDCWPNNARCVDGALSGFTGKTVQILFPNPRIDEPKDTFRVSEPIELDREASARLGAQQGVLVIQPGAYRPRISPDGQSVSLELAVRLARPSGQASGPSRQ